MIISFPESSLNDEAGKLFMEDYNQYKARAKLITEIYAGGAINSKILNKESYIRNKKLTDEN